MDNRIHKHFTATTVDEWIELNSDRFSETELDQIWEEQDELLDLVGKIISTQLSIVILRGVPGLCASNIDYMRLIYHQLAIEFGQKYPQFSEINPTYYF